MISIKVTTPAPDAFEKRGRKIREAMLKKMRRNTARDLKNLFRDTVFGWSNKPVFLAKYGGGLDELSVEVYTNDEIYALVNAGAKPHPIPKTGTTYMRFRPGYRASTTPGLLKSRRAYRSGPFVTAFKIPMHPGFVAREFDKTIRDHYLPTFYDDMQDAIREGNR